MSSQHPILFEALKNAKRIKVFIPYEATDLRLKFKSLNSSFWHPNQKLWSIVNTKENLEKVISLFENYGYYEEKN